MIETINDGDDGESLQSFKTRITNSQFAVMVDFMMLNPELIRRDFTRTFTKEMYTQKWEELAALLNADFTGAKKDVQGWRKCWRDRKSHLKVKAEKRDACLSEGTDPSYFELSDSEERLLQLIKENEPDDEKCIKYLKTYKRPSSHLNAKDSQQDVKKLNIQQKIKDNVSQILGILNKQVKANTANKVINNPNNQLSTFNNIPTQILPANHLLVVVDADTLQVVPSSTLEPSNNILMQVEPPNNNPVRNVSISSPGETVVLSDASCVMKDLMSKLSNEDDVQDSQKMNSSEEVHIDTQESPAEEINSNPSISESAVSNEDEVAFTPRKEIDEELINGSSEEDSVGKPPRKRVRFTHEAKSHFLGNNEDELVKVIERQNLILEGMARTLTRIEKSLGERSADEAQRKNSMLLKISDNIEQLGESLRTVSKSLKSIGE